MSEVGFHERFAQHLGKWLGESGRPRATLRRSLAFPPGTWPEAFPYVEPFVATAKGWTRQAAYLVAGLYAISRVKSGYGSMGAAAFRLKSRTASGSVETRFLALLDADEEQLAYRLRQMITLMSGEEIAPDWAELFRHLTNWNSADRWVQERWARDYYKHQVPGEEVDDGTANHDVPTKDVASTKGTMSDVESEEA